jgi:1-acyl-sn-glycerol-3-phosphate acyltransferase
MAVDGRAPVVPARIEQAYELFPKGARFVRPGVVRVTFGRPIAPDPWTCADDLDRQYQLYRDFTRQIEEQVAALKFSRDSKRSLEPGIAANDRR